MQEISLKEAALALGINYQTLRSYAAKYKVGFPDPLLYDSRGHGKAWDLDAITEWWTLRQTNKQNGGANHHKDPSGRARLGHQFRQVRKANKCTDCYHRFSRGEQIWELQTGNLLEILCTPCYVAWEASLDDRSADDLQRNS